MSNSRINVAIGIMFVFGLSLIGLIIYSLVTEPAGTLAGLGVIFGFIALMWAMMVIGEEL